MEYVLNALCFPGVVRKVSVYSGLRRAVKCGICCGKWKMVPDEGHGMLRSPEPP